jgi:hypothetical protein
MTCKILITTDVEVDPAKVADFILALNDNYETSMSPEILLEEPWRILDVQVQEDSPAD